MHGELVKQVQLHDAVNQSEHARLIGAGCEPILEVPQQGHHVVVEVEQTAEGAHQAGLAPAVRVHGADAGKQVLEEVGPHNAHVALMPIGRIEVNQFDKLLALGLTNYVGCYEVDGVGIKGFKKSYCVRFVHKVLRIQ